MSPSKEDQDTEGLDSNPQRPAGSREAAMLSHNTVPAGSMLYGFNAMD